MAFPIRLSHMAAAGENLLAALMHCNLNIDPEEKSKVKFKCPKCTESVIVPQSHFNLFGPTTVCDPCTAKRKTDVRMDDAKLFWSRTCPISFRNTDIKHEKFNLNAYNRARQISMDSGYKDSIVLYGDTGSCKTRIACQLAKMALANGKTIALHFPEDLKDRPRFQSRKEILVNLTSPDFIVLDDIFIAGAAKEDTADFIKDLIDRRYRNNKATIITSQSTAEDFATDARKFGSMSPVEYQRIEAIVRRVRESFTCIDCDNLSELETEEEGRF